MAIYDEFLYSSERVIESRLKSDHGFTQQQVSAFYDALKDNLARFEETNKDTVDMLYSFIDFDKFKAQMLMIKKNLETRDAGTEGGSSTADVIN